MYVPVFIMLLRFDTILCSNLRTKTLLRAISNVHTGPFSPRAAGSALLLDIRGVDTVI